MTRGILSKPTPRKVALAAALTLVIVIATKRSIDKKWEDQQED